MSRLEATYRRLFCRTLNYYGKEKMELGHIYFEFQNQPLQYVYVGKNKLWIKKLSQNEKRRITKGQMVFNTKLWI